MSTRMSRKRKPFSQIPIEDDRNSSSSKRPRDDDDNNNCEKRAGTIHHMILKNFMCHSFLEVKFTNNISIIIGKNGSGKSAILTALIIGLGGKASITNRGQNVKGFVKAGERSGSIEIELLNEGPMAYKPGIYGKRINILRTFSASGTSSYKIRDENGEVISTHAKEVQNITAGLNIQVDNPVCVLNQETSRNFLNSSDSKKKFLLFMKATQLDVLENEYKKTEENKEKSIHLLKDKIESFKRLEDELKKLKRKIETHNEMGNLKDKNKQLQLELAWAKVRDAELELEQEGANVESLEKKLTDFKDTAEKRAEQFINIDSKINELQQQISEMRRQIEVQERPEQEIKAGIDQLACQYTNKKKLQAQLQASIQAKKGDISTLEKEIATHSEKISKAEEEKMQKLKSTAALQDNLKKIDSQIEASKNDLFQIRSDLSRKEEEADNLRKEILQCDQKIGEEHNNLSALQNGLGNDLLLYGRDMARVKEMINHYKSRFHQEPRGPLGHYIKLKDKKWAIAVESYIGPANLSSFAVDNRKDGQLLQEIFKQTWTGGAQPQIITSKFFYKKHDVTKNLVAEPNGCIGLYNAIDIDDPIVSNCIVDICSPENILLIPNDTRAHELLSERAVVPRNCKQGVTITGDRYYPDPNYRTYSSTYRKARYLQVDTKEYMQRLQITLDNLRKKKESITKQLVSLTRNMRDQEGRKNQLEEKVRKVNLARLQIRKQLEELNSQAEQEVHDVQYLEQELEELKKTIAEKTAEMEQIIIESKSIKIKIQSNTEKLRQLRGSTMELEERCQSLQNEVREHRSKLQTVSTSDEFDQRRIKEYEEKLKIAKSGKLTLASALKKLQGEASNIGDRMPDIRQVQQITSDINRLKHRIESIETITGNIADVKKRCSDMAEKHEKCSELIHCLKCDIKELTTALEQRNSHYKKTESYFITSIKCYFAKILESRQFKGSIDINMRDKKLELIVIPQHGSQGVTSTANLSGGERSFSTVAFLYSLWQCMEFPFYFLDEFDVYMDKLNRTKVIDILVHHAKSRPQLQFVFLTPQDVSFISKDVSILRLADPERFNGH